MNLRLYTPGALLCAVLASPAQSAGEFDLAIEQARAAIDEASAAGYEWRDSRLLLAEAIKAKAAGDIDTAMQLAEKARLQGIIALTQAAREKTGSPTR